MVCTIYSNPIFRSRRSPKYGMPRLSLWNGGTKGATYNYIDRAISEFFGISGTEVLVHRYLGTHNQDPDAAPTAAQPGETSIQDVLFMENRDRRYSDEIIPIVGLYNVADVDFDLRQFGMFLQNDTIFLEVHMNDTIAQIGRKLMSGDVLELPHQRDEDVLNGGKAINKFYVIDDVNRSSTGYSPTWFPHILRLKCSPMAAAEEYSDILDRQAKDPFGFDDGKLRDVLTNIGIEMNLNEEVVEAAKASVSGRNFDTRHFYVVPGDGDQKGKQNPWIFAGDGVPPNGAELVGSGNKFPQGAVDGDYYLRLDYHPQALFKKIGERWKIQELDYRETEWSAASSILKGFINQTGTETHKDGSVQPIRQGLHKAVRPRADF
jgi:hypothetical protein